MFLWQTIWAPQIHFPASGNVVQRIEPDTHWFFDSIDVNAGDGKIEEKAFAIASYGRQLGWLSEILIDLADREVRLSPLAAESLRRLKNASKEIEQIKRDESAATAAEVEEKLEWLRRNKASEYQSLVRRLGAASGEGHS